MRNDERSLIAWTNKWERDRRTREVAGIPEPDAEETTGRGAPAFNQKPTEIDAATQSRPEKVMSSISSSRKGRPNAARDTDEITVTGDFRSIVREWQQRTYKPDQACGRLIDDGLGDAFEIQLDCLSVDGWNEPIRLTERFSIPEGTVIPRGSIPVFRFTLKCDNRAAILANRAVDDDERILDLVEAREATEEEIRCAADSERPAPRTPRTKPAPVPTYTSIDRAADPVSRLGSQVGASELQPIAVGPKWSCHAFHLSSPQIIGRLRVTLGIHETCGQPLELKVFDPVGRCVLDLTMQRDTIQFDQRLLDPGDYLLCFRSPGPGCTGEGSRNVPNSRLLSELPEKPQLDAVLSRPISEFGDVAILCFTFSAQ